MEKGILKIINNPNGFAPYTKYNWCSRCARYILKGKICDEHPTFKLRTNAKRSTNTKREIKRIG